MYCFENINEQKQTYLDCLLCDLNFGPISGKCEPCQKNCLVCMNDNKKCTACDVGYQIDSKGENCLKIDGDFCYRRNDDGKC